MASKTEAAKTGDGPLTWRRRRARGSRAPRGSAQARDPRRYEILGEHGRGALGRVSRARDREIGRDVAIKELLVRGGPQEERFLREVQITARLEHPGIVPVYEAGRWPDGKPFYTMRSVSGRPLRELIVECEVEDRIGLLHHVIAVADAIAYAHGRHIIHRDLKPSNIIVGEFGETIVIDWGLAKDLTTTDPSGPGGGPACAPACAPDDDELTIAGTVLGTPAYMAPEQQRGEPVDQRADVFAIGIMLWELCAAERKPPAEPRVRHRVLRRAGIDRDLVSIMDKALEPDPERRYRDGAALAADLQAFKSGARITARHYTLFALLAHWTHRHRALAATAAVLVGLGVIAGFTYVRKIAAERDRADASQGLAEAALDQLRLKHAQTLLTTDPTAALDELAGYHGADRGGAEQIRAEAVGRGVALVRGLPHTNNVLWAEGTADGAILSLGLDGVIARTSRDGRSTVVARGVSRSRAIAYAPAAHLLAYACDPSDVCLFDALRASRASPTPALRDVKVAAVALSRDGTLLAVVSRDAVLTIVDVADPSRPVVRYTRHDHPALAVTFVDDRSVALEAATGIVLVPFAGEPEGFSARELSTWDTRPGACPLAVGTASGEAYLLAVAPLHVTARAELCHGPVAGLRFLPGRGGLAYACGSGAIGIWDPDRGVATPRAQLEGRADLLATDPTGSYLVAAGGNGTVTVLDLESDLVASYKGQGFRLTSITAPGAEHGFVVSGDAHGGVRAWPLPPRLARVAATASTRFTMAIFDDVTGAIAATTWHPELTIVDPSGASRVAQPHLPDNLLLEQARSGRRFATYGLSDVVELWSSATMTRSQLVNTGHGSVSQVRFTGEDGDFVTAGHDGRLVRWTSTGQPTEVAHADQPIDRFALVTAGASVFSTVDGSLWRSDAAGHVVRLRDAGARINRIVAIPDAARVYAGDANGEVIVVDTGSWRPETVLRAASAILEMAATRDGRTVAVATSEGTLHVGTCDPVAPGPARLTWTTWAARAREIALAPDGLLVATYSDGTIWLHAPGQQRWLCVPSGTMDLARVAVAPRGQAAVVADVEGRLIWVDLAAARRQMTRTLTPDNDSPGSPTRKEY